MIRHTVGGMSSSFSQYWDSLFTWQWGSCTTSLVHAHTLNAVAFQRSLLLPCVVVVAVGGREWLVNLLNFSTCVYRPNHPDGWLPLLSGCEATLKLLLPLGQFSVDIYFNYLPCCNISGSNWIYFCFFSAIMNLQCKKMGVFSVICDLRWDLETNTFALFAILI